MRASMSTLFLLALVACDTKETDVDGDGVEAPADCDDTDPAVKPGAAELCDGIDNDCDGSVDEGLGEEYYPDEDGDGFGVVTGRFTACAQPDFASTAFGDCDDTDANIHPDADEDCSDVDRDCDGDPTAGATDVTTFYRDVDGDGYGDENGLTQAACEVPTGYVTAIGDCDDGSADISPVGTEVCNGLDDDCDDSVDEDAADAQTVYPDADNDGFGEAGNGVLACPMFGFTDDGTDCDDTNPNVRPSADEVCDGGVDNDCDPSTDEDVVDGDTFYRDLDGDGFGDVAVLACIQPGDASEDDGDCDDGDPTINPDADELCDAIDRDCDLDPTAGALDATRYYRDLDNDGFGATAGSVTSCEPVEDFITTGGDCNDSNSSVNPDALERCNGIDDDCNVTTSEDAGPDATDWYLDLDGDGFAGGDVVRACERPLDAFAASLDCDDTDDGTYPGANDVCDGIDNDCDPSTDENTSNRWYEDADADGFGNASVFSLGCLPDPALANPVDNGEDCDDTDSLSNPRATPNCEQEHCGTIGTNETWRSTLVHIVTCNVEVKGANSPQLTIEGGTRVEFRPDTQLLVANGSPGSIRVLGGSDPVVMTSAEPIPANGDWFGVSIGNGNDGSLLEGLEISYAGGGNDPNAAGLIINDADVDVIGLTSRRNAGHGVYVGDGEPLLHAVTLIDNDRNGLFVAANKGLSRVDSDGGFGPSLRDSVILGNGDRPITIPGSHADEIDITNVLSDTLADNGIPEIELLSGTMRSTGTWRDHSIPYFVSSSQTVRVEDGPNAVLTVEDGATVLFDGSAGLSIGEAAAGRLEINAGVDPATVAGVTFTASPNLIINNLNWLGVTFGANDTGSELRGLTIEHGGGNGQGNLVVTGSEPWFDAVTSQLSDNAGIYVQGVGSAPEITDSFLVDNDTHGIYVSPEAGLFRRVGVPTFRNNVVTGNGQSPAVVPPNFVGELDATTSFIGNGDRVLIHGGTVLEVATWQNLDEDYGVLGSLTIAGPQDPTVTIQPGAQFYMASNTSISAGIGNDGALRILGGAPNGAPRVVFTSADPAPGAGDWVGLRIGDNGPLFEQSILQGVEIHYAGGAGGGGPALIFQNQSGCTPDPSIQRKVVFEDARIVDSSGTGVAGLLNSTVEMRDVTIDRPFNGTCVGFSATTVPECRSATLTAFDNIVCNGLSIGSVNMTNIHLLDPNGQYGSYIELQAEAIDRDVDIRAFSIPYRVTGDLTIGGPGTPTMTIEDGADLIFTGDAGIAVAAGGLVANGAGISMTPLDDGNPWDGITLLSDLCLLELSELSIDQAGDNAVGGAIYNQGLCPNSFIDNVVFTNSDRCDYVEDFNPALNPMMIPIIPFTGTATICDTQ